jgi:hypothetical protein
MNLLAEFQSDVAKDGRIDLHLEGDMSSFLSVRYLNNTETKSQLACLVHHTPRW